MHKKNKKGITLVELICTIAASAILLLVVGRILITLSAQFVIVMDKTNAKTASAIMLETMEQRIRLGKSAMFSYEMSDNPAYTVLYSNEEGLLMESKGGVETPLFEKEFYKGLQSEVLFGRNTSRSLIINIKFTKNGKEVYTTSRTITLLNTLPTQAPNAGEVVAGAGAERYMHYTV